MTRQTNSEQINSQESHPQTSRSSQSSSFGAPFGALAGRQETQGYLMFFSGIVLFFYAIGWLPETLENILNFVFAGAAVALSLYGAHKAILWAKAQKLYRSFTKK